MDDKKKTSRPFTFYIASVAVLVAEGGGAWYNHKSLRIEISSVR